MKYNTIGSSNLASEGRKSTLKIYTDTDLSDQNNKMSTVELELATIRGELEIVQKALKLQTKRCRQLVGEYTRRLQQKEQQYQCEKTLRDDQLAKVLRALIIFEARLKQEQKFISHQLKEKDYIITKQSNEIKKLLSQQYCKNCNQYYNTSSTNNIINNNNNNNNNSPSLLNLESLDSSSEYVVTDYQSSNFESLDSGSDIYATISEKSYNTEKSDNSDSNKIFIKNTNNNNVRKLKKIRKNSGNYFEILKIRSNNLSPYSNDDNTSNDYDNLDSLPAESVIDNETITKEENDSSSNLTISECNNTVINNKLDDNGEEDEEETSKLTKISEAIPVFESGGDDVTNDNWYASASDQEDEQQRDIYRNNPVLECMNQILLQNINDTMVSPPKTPSIERKLQNKNKKVKFSDEEQQQEETLPETQPPPPPPTTTTTIEDDNHDYYETPIQKLPNYYETPQSIYSNDYEQILSKCSETFTNPPINHPHQPDSHKTIVENNNNHLYVDLDTTTVVVVVDGGRKTKISRTPPALPPKPANLMLKYKRIVKDAEILESEPDYCSISELNLPQPPIKSPSFKKISVIAEINPPNSQDVINKIGKANNCNQPITVQDDCVVVNDDIPSLIVKKCVEKLNIQLAKQTTIKSDVSSPPPPPPPILTPTKSKGSEIPKLPQVSEIIIPDDDDDDDDDKKQQEECISHDNYVKNNSQILKMKNTTIAATTTTPVAAPTNRRSILMGTSVSNLITGFNNQQLISEIHNKKPTAERVVNNNNNNKLDKKLFSSFENLQNLNKHGEDDKSASSNFDLSQNFEEFKLDDCEIEEYTVDDLNNELNQEQNSVDLVPPPPLTTTTTNGVDLINNYAPNMDKTSVELLKQQLENNQCLSTMNGNNNNVVRKSLNEPTYEYFLECTGLSSKSILTPSRLLSNHKSMLKPKDIKLRSKVKSNSNLLFDRNSTSTIRYWTEPYI